MSTKIYLIDNHIIEHNIETNQNKIIDTYNFDSIYPLNFGYVKRKADYIYEITYFDRLQKVNIVMPVMFHEIKPHILGNALIAISHNLHGINILNIPENKSLVSYKAKSRTPIQTSNVYVTTNLSDYIYVINLDTLDVSNMNINCIYSYESYIDPDDVLCCIVSENYGTNILTIESNTLIWHNSNGKVFWDIGNQSKIIFKKLSIVDGKVVITVICTYKCYTYVYLINIGKHENYIEEHIITDNLPGIVDFHIDRYGFMITYNNAYYFENTIEAISTRGNKFAFMMNSNSYHNKRCNTIAENSRLIMSLAKIIADY